MTEVGLLSKMTSSIDTFQTLIRPRHQAEQGMEVTPRPHLPPPVTRSIVVIRVLPRQTASKARHRLSSFFIVSPMGRAASCGRPSQPDSPVIDRTYSSVQVRLAEIGLVISRTGALECSTVSLVSSRIE
ncbi:hypothetical protein PRIPAC_90307 [Pristionchus pacificus]|uniref:Uncharacterized protein n=1 Tax=Pristionchus pacificus TaxID=54126 RepID=A0A2A6B943_PRIPA|nr:hypothetical protein PRIPAC_90307 [Pristionchus pacificus]|eukprot:PDM62400.1 hypothetical protein PRIPAC_51842 [Pristionchus pacificus]